MSEKQLPSGLFMPGQPSDLAARVEAELVEQAAIMVRWAKAWPKKGQAALTRGDIMDCTMLKMKVFAWNQDFSAAVYQRSCELLGLAPPPAPQPENRQKRRADRKREGRPPLKTVPNPNASQPIPQPDVLTPGGSQTTREAFEPTGTGSPGPFGQSLAPQPNAILSEIQKNPLKEFNRKRP